MRPPRKVKVGYRDFTVTARSVVEMNEERALGLTFKDRALIDLDETLDRQQMAETLLHETLHAIWHVQCLPGKAGEEQVVTALSKGLAGVFRDNPEAIKWILAGLKAK